MPCNNPCAQRWCEINYDAYRNNQPWTSDERKIYLEMIGAGSCYYHIAYRLRRSFNAINQEACRTGRHRLRKRRAGSPEFEKKLDHWCGKIAIAFLQSNRNPFAGMRKKNRRMRGLA